MKSLLQPSKQARSRATHLRILAATERLLIDEDFEAISIRRIVEEANTSIGSFYARFRDKDALLPVLYEQYEQNLTRQVTRLEKKLATTENLEATTLITAQHFVTTFGHNPNLNRALYEYATRAPESEEAQALSARRMDQYEFLIQRLTYFAEASGHTHPRRSAELGLYFVTVVTRNRLFYPLAPQTRSIKLSHRELGDEMARMLRAYLS